MKHMIKTIKEAHQWAFSLLEKNQIKEAKSEAEWMIMALYEWSRSQFFLHLQDQISDQKMAQLTEWLERRIHREPLQYILGQQDFYGRTFQVNPNVLIPRPETELLVEAVIKEAEQIWLNQPLKVADIGTGSGAIAITLSLEKPNWKVYAVDISEQALQVAQQNVGRLAAKVTFFQGNLILPIIENKLMMDIIVSNPPYIPQAEVEGLMPEVRDYEPTLALAGGKDGLDCYRQILEQSEKVLKRPGLIAYEIGIHQSKAIEQLFNRSGADQVRVIPDYQGIPRIITALYV